MIIILFLAVSERTKKPAVNSSSDGVLNQQLVNIIRLNRGADVTAGWEPGRPRHTRDHAYVLKGDFLQCL